jgi:hypothetical protein
VIPDLGYRGCTLTPSKLRALPVSEFGITIFLEPDGVIRSPVYESVRGLTAARVTDNQRTFIRMR